MPKMLSEEDVTYMGRPVIKRVYDITDIGERFHVTKGCVIPAWILRVEEMGFKDEGMEQVIYGRTAPRTGCPEGVVAFSRKYYGITRINLKGAISSYRPAQTDQKAVRTQQ
jgi:hypothetical protein